MNKRILAGLALTGLGLFIHSCKTATTAGTPFTNTTMKPWFDNNCGGCHSGRSSASGAWSYDASNYEGSIKANISKIYSAVYVRKNMPPNGITTEEMATFKKWYDAGYPGN